MFDSRTNLANDVIGNVKENINEKIFETVIPRNIRLAEAPSFGMPIISYDNSCAGADAYRKMTAEFLKGNVTDGSKKRWPWSRS